MSQIKPTQSPRQRLPRQKDVNHLEFIRKLPCLVSGVWNDRTESAHVRFASAEFGKRESGKQEKPDDCWTVPLSPWWHRDSPDAQHKMNEQVFWQTHNINVLQVCRLLYSVTGDINTGANLITRARKGEFPWKT